MLGFGESYERIVKIVALEEHTFPRDILQAAGLDLGSRASRKADELNDLGEGRLCTMDAAGVDMAMVCLRLLTLLDARGSGNRGAQFPAPPGRVG